MTETIAQSYTQTAKTLGGLCTDQRLSDEESAVPLILWQDQWSRLKLWAANIGAHQTGQSSLDFRLRNAAHVHIRVLSLLKGLRSSLDDLEQLVAPGDAVEAEGESDVEDLTVEERRDELRGIYALVKSLIDCLFQLSMSIRVPGKRQRIRSANDDGLPGIIPGLDRRRLADKFPHARPSLCHRLATATARRRAALEDFKRHRSKLSYGIDDDSDRKTVQSSTVATSYHPDDKAAEDAKSEAGNSETSFATSIFESETHRSIPAPPEGALNGEPFECPYCFFIIEVRSSTAWARHLFQDLMPYNCVFSGCNIPGRLYDKRRDWYLHNHENHGEQLAEGKCPLCLERLSSAQLTRHIARHLQDVALFVLPTHEGANTIGDESSASDSDSVGPQDPVKAMDALPSQYLREIRAEERIQAGGQTEITDTSKNLIDQGETPEEPIPRGAIAGSDEDNIPPDARWTKVSRYLVNPEALEQSGERFEERDDFVIVKRVVRKAEIKALAELTKKIRLEREAKHAEREAWRKARLAERKRYDDDIDEETRLRPRTRTRPSIHHHHIRSTDERRTEYQQVHGEPRRQQWWKCHKCGKTNRLGISIDCYSCRHEKCSLCTQSERPRPAAPTSRQSTSSRYQDDSFPRETTRRSAESELLPPTTTARRHMLLTERGIEEPAATSRGHAKSPLPISQYVTPTEVFLGDMMPPPPPPARKSSRSSILSRLRRLSGRGSDKPPPEEDVDNRLQRSASADGIGRRKLDGDGSSRG